MGESGRRIEVTTGVIVKAAINRLQALTEMKSVDPKSPRFY